MFDITQNVISVGDCLFENLLQHLKGSTCWSGEVGQEGYTGWPIVPNVLKRYKVSLGSIKYKVLKQK